MKPDVHPSKRPVVRDLRPEDVEQVVHLDTVLTDPGYENARFNLWNGIFLEACRDCRGTVTIPIGKPPLVAIERTSTSASAEELA